MIPIENPTIVLPIFNQNVCFFFVRLVDSKPFCWFVCSVIDAHSVVCFLYSSLKRHSVLSIRALNALFVNGYRNSRWISTTDFQNNLLNWKISIISDGIKNMNLMGNVEFLINKIGHCHDSGCIDLISAVEMTNQWVSCTLLCRILIVLEEQKKNELIQITITRV